MSKSNLDLARSKYTASHTSHIKSLRKVNEQSPIGGRRVEKNPDNHKMWPGD